MFTRLDGSRDGKLRQCEYVGCHGGCTSVYPRVGVHLHLYRVKSLDDWNIPYITGDNLLVGEA